MNPPHLTALKAPLACIKGPRSGGAGVNDMPVACQSRAPECPQAFGWPQGQTEGIKARDTQRSLSHGFRGGFLRSHATFPGKLRL